MRRAARHWRRLSANGVLSAPQRFVWDRVTSFRSLHWSLEFSLAWALRGPELLLSALRLPSRLPKLSLSARLRVPTQNRQTIRRAAILSVHSRCSRRNRGTLSNRTCLPLSHSRRP